jgi:hypothetical protein
MELPEAKRTMQKQKEANVDFPTRRTESADKKAGRTGITPPIHY